jgi:hypothetical protein
MGNAASPRTHTSQVVPAYREPPVGVSLAWRLLVVAFC